MGAHLMAPERLRYTPCGDGHVVWHGWGPLTGRPVLLLHGGSGSWTHWVRNIPALAAAGHQVWAPDMPGFGDSAALPPGSDADAIVPHLAAGLRALPVAGPCDVLAFSFGSLVATLLATAHPDSVARLLLVGLPVLPLASGRGVPLTRVDPSASVAERDAAHRANLAAIMLHRTDSLDDETVALQAANATRDRMRSRRLVTTDTCQKAVQALACDFACVWGEEDVLYRGRWGDVRAVCESNPQCAGTSLVPEAGHWVQYEAASMFNQMALNFLFSEIQIKNCPPTTVERSHLNGQGWA